MPADASDQAADRCRADDRRRKQNPDKRPDRDASPGAVLRRLLMLLHVNLAVRVLGDHRDVIGADELRLVKIDQAVVVGEGTVAVGIDRGVYENGSVAHLVSCFAVGLTVGAVVPASGNSRAVWRLRTSVPSTIRTAKTRMPRGLRKAAIGAQAIRAR